MSDFVNLHCHSYYSLMDGLDSPLDLCQAAKDLGQTALAITDHGTLSSHRNMQEAALATGIKPILGVEAYLSPTDRFDRREVKKRDDNTSVYNHLVLLAKDQAGLKNLQKLSELAWTEGFYHKPRIDKEILSEYGEGLVILSGCLNGVISKAIERDDNESAERWMDYFAGRFEGDFYIEIQPDNPAEINRGLVEYARRYGVRTTVTADCHFAKPEDRALEEAMLILSTSPKVDKTATYESTKHLPIFERLNTLYPDRPISFEKLDLYIQGRATMIDKLEAQGITDRSIYDSTVEIADKIGSYEYPKSLDLLPAPKVDPDKRLEELALAGLKKRGCEGEEYQLRIKEELDILREMNFSTYFLIVSNMVKWAKGKEILVGPGRGSAAGSLVCYALGITEIDPIKYGLLFFRFINPERADFPDIDTDFEDRRRKEVKDYLRRQFKNVASISTFTVFKDKGVVRDAARVFNVPLGDVNKALKSVEKFEDFERDPSIKWFRDKYPEVEPYARNLRGRIRSVGVHASGIVVSSEPLENYAPIETRTDPKDKVSGRIPVIACDMNEAADIGLVKIDALGLKTLSVISDAMVEIESRHGKKINLEELPLDDPAIYKDLSNGFTVGVFQADATPYTRLLKRMGVDNFEDLAASNALVRPGAMNTVGEKYIARKQGREQTTFAHDILEPFTRNTFGVIIYQEQVMLAMHHLAGMSMATADNVRKIIGKKKDVREFDAYRDEFIEGASKNVHRSVAEGLWHDFEAHANYSFNRSHAVAYSMITYWSAWIKHYYPIEYMYGLLKNEDSPDKRTTLLIEAKRLGIRIMLPHVNLSGTDFEIQDDGIRFGLSSVKFISDTLSERLIKLRPFSHYSQLYDAVMEKGSGLNTRVLGGLNAIGGAAMDGNPRTGNEKYKYYEYLGIPQFEVFDFPDHVMDVVRPIEDFDESECFVILAMVKSIKRSKGWSRVEVVDETGAAGIFHNEETQIEPGHMYFILVTANRIARYIPVNDVAKAIKDGSDDAVINYLLSPDLGLTPGTYYVIRFEKRMTKARKMMGTITLVNGDRDMKKVLAFPKEFAQAYTKAKEGEVITLSLGKLDDGSLCVRSI